MLKYNNCRNSVIGTRSVVLRNIPKNFIALGNPCKVVIKMNWNEYIKNSDE